MRIQYVDAATHGLDPRTRLEHCLDLPLGTVLTDLSGIDYIFIGASKNTVGLVFEFVAKAGTFRGIGMPCTFSLLEGGLRKFPGLAKFLKKP